MRTRQIVIGLITASAVLLASLAANAADRTKLVVGTQDAAFPQVVLASKVLDGAPYDVEWAVLPGPAAQLAALYSKATDVGLMGDTSLVIEQGRAKTDWTANNLPLQIVAGWRNPDQANYPPIVTAVRNDAGINSLADLRGKRWANNFGGFNYAQFLLSRIKAGLKTNEIESVQLVDSNASGAAFNAGRVEVYSGSLWSVKESIDKGKAHIILTSDQLEIPALTVFTARSDVIRDPAKNKALYDFLSRVRQQWVWYQTHIDVVTAIWHEKIKQTAERSDFNARNGLSVFYPLDDSLIAREQKIADTLAASGDIAKQIDVGVEFARQFNGATVPPAQ
jgi:sulfonate transport system substrate-binding protein